jgi:hypothetical protein
LKSFGKENQIPSLAGVVVSVCCSSSSCFGIAVVVDVFSSSSFSTFVSLFTGTFGVVVVVFGFGINRWALPIK